MMRQRFLSVLLALTMLLSLMPATVFAAEPGEESEFVTLEEDEFYTNDELLEMYFYAGDLDSSAYTLPELTTNQKALYDALAAKVEAVATGTETSTKFKFDTTFTKEDAIVALDCLIMGCPQYFYWWGRGRSITANTGIDLNVAKGYYTGNGETITFTDGSTDTWYFTVDSSKTTAANTAIANANAIVTRYEGKTTYEKLDGYRKEICDLVTYYTEAAGGSINDYTSNPWEIVYVFDGDESTNVVCEGYSRAFQYLCNLSGETLGAECYTVSGTMSGGTGAGGHMWNIVRIDGKSYLVDVTNCDGNAVGAPRNLFLVGGGKDSSATAGYSYAVGGKTVTYKYYDSSSGAGHTDQFAVLGNTILTLAADDYVDPDAPTSIEIVLNPESDATDKTNVLFMVPTLKNFPNAERTIQLTATATNDSGETLTGRAFEWVLSGTSDKGISLTYDSGNSSTATLTISSSALSNLNPLGETAYFNLPVTVTASSSTEKSTPKEIGIVVTHRNAASVKIVKGAGGVTEDTISAGSSAVYTAEVYDQYGVKMDGREVISGLNGSTPVKTNQTVPTVTWSVTPTGQGVSVSGGTVTVGENAAAGEYTVTAAVGTETTSPSAAVKVTVTTDTPEHQHQWSTEWSKDNDYHWHECTDANCPENDNSKKGGYAAHVWDAGKETKPATCTTDGVKTFTCSVCGQTKTETVSKLGHDFTGSWVATATGHAHKCTRCDATGTETSHTMKKVVDKAATCTEAGSEHQECEVCGYKEAATTIPALGHSYGTTYGHDDTNHWLTCSRCGDKQTEAHNMPTDFEVDTPATYTSSGVQSKTCTKCGYKVQEDIPMKQHTFASPAVYKMDNDFHWEECSCADADTDATHTTAVRNKAVHTWDAGTETVPPTDEAEGVRTYTCTVCGQTRTEAIGKTGHTWSEEWSHDASGHWKTCTQTHEGVSCTETTTKEPHVWAETGRTDATYEAPGVIHYACVCDETKDETIPQLQHHFSTIWSHDAEQHWHDCTDEGCNAKGSLADHIYDNDADTTCDTCGYTRTVTPPVHEHSWASDWRSDASGHWHVCTGCGEKDAVVPHVYDNDGDDTCNTCGYKRTVPDTPRTFTVTLNANGGTVSSASLTTGADGKLASLPTPTRSGYTFNGWFTAASGGTQVTVNTVFSADATVYAHWTSNSSSSGGGGGGGSSSSSSSGTTTRNPDGTTTTTTTRSDGTTVETTNRTDGTREVVETKKDGTVVTTETNKNGDKVVTTENKDGSVQEVVTNKDGSSATVTTSASGSVEADVTVKPVDGAADAPISPVRVGGGDVVVTIKTGADDTTKVQVPVSNISSGVVAVLVKADGTEEVITTSIPTENGLLVPVKDGETVKIEDRSKSFQDMGNTSWAQNAVDFVSARGMFAGTSDDTFSPNSNLTRAQMVTVLARCQGVDISGGSTWYEKSVEWAKEAGVSDGTAPDRQISREQMVVMLWRVAGSPDAADASRLQSFNDAGSVAEYARPAMAWAIENGMISGVGADRISPQGTATRAQVAVVLARFVQNIEAQK